MCPDGNCTCCKLGRNIISRQTEINNEQALEIHDLKAKLAEMEAQLNEKRTDGFANHR